MLSALTVLGGSSEAAAQQCDPNYLTWPGDPCVPVSAADLNCADINNTPVRVVGTDPHSFDGDNDGTGCDAERAAPPAPTATPAATATAIPPATATAIPTVTSSTQIPTAIPTVAPTMVTQVLGATTGSATAASGTAAIISAADAGFTNGIPTAAGPASMPLMTDLSAASGSTLALTGNDAGVPTGIALMMTGAGLLLLAATWRRHAN